MNALRLVEAEDTEQSSLTIAAAADGDAAAQAQLVRRWTPAMFRFCLRMVGDEQDASDLSQEVLLRMLRNLDRYDPSRSFSTWIFGIARNACIDHHRRGKRRRHEPLDEVPCTRENPLTLVTREQRAERLREALDQIGPMYREVLVMYHFEHLTYAEIAEALQLPMGTVMNRIFRARQKVRAIYDDAGEAP